MSNNMSKFKALALLLPLIGMIAMIVVHTHNRETGTNWRIPVTGYDPRDLLRGHYLTFRYDWNWAETQQTCQGQDCALCLSPVDNSGVNPEVALMSKDLAVQTCDTFIVGSSYRGKDFRIGSDKANGLTRYYIPENRAELLDKALRLWTDDAKFEVSLSINESGQAFIDQMYINDMVLEDWLYLYEHPNTMYRKSVF